MEASIKAEPVDVDEVSPKEIAEEELNLDVDLVDGNMQENNSEIVLNEFQSTDNYATRI